jgi:hypothetical protein
MADLPLVQEGAAGTQIQAAGVADEHNGILVPALPLSVEHLHDF